MITSVSTCRSERCCSFITAACADPRATLLTRHIHALGAAVREVQRTLRVRIDAFVVLPDHLHAICSAPHPADAAAFCRATAATFARRIAREPHDASTAIRELQWDCATLRIKHMQHVIDSIHLEPVRHGLVVHAAFWPWSSVSRYVQGGIDPAKRHGVREEKIAFDIHSGISIPMPAAIPSLLRKTRYVTMSPGAPAGAGVLLPGGG